MIVRAVRVPRAVPGPAKAASCRPERTDACSWKLGPPWPREDPWPRPECGQGAGRSALRPGRGEEGNRAGHRRAGVRPGLNKMASGQGPGPPGEGCGEPPEPSTSEQQVARDTEEVFRSYVFHRHRQEQEAEGAAAPADPEMISLHLEPNSTMGQVGRQLAIIGDDINQRYDSDFQNMLEKLQPTAENAYELFTKIALSLFESGINWGRVVALLAFGYRLALYIYRRGLTGFLGQVTRFVADFVVHHCIAQWIAQRGGWVAVLSSHNPILTVLAALAVVAFCQFVVRRHFKS